MRVEQLVEQRAARVVVVLVFAVKAFFVEEDPVDRFDDALDVARSFQTLAHGAAPGADFIEIMTDLQPRPVFQRDDERCLDEIELLLGQTRDLAEALQQLVGAERAGGNDDPTGLDRAAAAAGDHPGAFAADRVAV